jgi:NAD/NADP transhydrogenase alpha subunit
VVSIVDIATDGGGNNDETEKQQVFSQYYNHL